MWISSERTIASTDHLGCWPYRCREDFWHWREIRGDYLRLEALFLPYNGLENRRFQIRKPFSAMLANDSSAGDRRTDG
jgi:hypothetical protein